MTGADGAPGRRTGAGTDGGEDAAAGGGVTATTCGRVRGKRYEYCRHATSALSGGALLDTGGDAGSDRFAGAP